MMLRELFKIGILSLTDWQETVCVCGMWCDDRQGIHYKRILIIRSVLMKEDEQKNKIHNFVTGSMKGMLEYFLKVWIELIFFLNEFDDNTCILY